MQIVVTGAAGFVGSHLCERLASLNYNVVGVDSFSDHYPVWLKERNAHELADAGVQIKRLDLARDKLEGAIADAELVFHLAAQPGIAARVPPDAYVRNNLVATYALLEACASCKRRPFLVNVSTSSVYGRRATAEETARTRAYLPLRRNKARRRAIGIGVLARAQVARVFHASVLCLRPARAPRKTLHETDNQHLAGRGISSIRRQSAPQARLYICGRRRSRAPCYTRSSRPLCR